VSQAQAALTATAEDGWALITGASSGIGLSYAKALAARGSNLLLVADDAGLRQVATDLVDAHRARVDFLVTDLAKDASIGELKSWVGSRQVDVLINNAGRGRKGPFTAARLEDDVDLVKINAIAPLAIMRLLVPSMAERGRGAVINVSSINALSPVPNSAVYSATKTMLLYTSLAIRQELRSSGIAFQVVLPGTTDTRFHDPAEVRLPKWAMSADRVVESSLTSLGKKPVCVPGLLTRVFWTLGPLIPLTDRAAAAGEVLTATFGSAGDYRAAKGRRSGSPGGHSPGTAPSRVSSCSCNTHQGESSASTAASSSACTSPRGQSTHFQAATSAGSGAGS